MSTEIFLYQPLLHQATVNGIVKYEGSAGFFPDDGIVELHPSKPETGLVLFWRGGKFQALIDYISPSPFRTTALSPEGLDRIDSGNAIYTIEHLLSAIYGLGIINCEIHVSDNGLIPFYDGSAHDFCNKILEVGIAIQEKHYRRAIACQKQIRVENGDSYIQIDPPTGSGLKITAQIDFQEPIGQQVLHYTHSTLSYCLNVAWARTFATKDFISEEETRKDLPVFRLQRKIEDSYIETPMLVFKDGRFITTLRRTDEPIRHKILDFIGDIALLGFDLHGDVLIHKSGHALNWKFVREIRTLFNSQSDSLNVNSGGKVKPKYVGDKSRYVRDVTLKDGDRYEPNQKLVKTWEIENVGSVQWIGRALIRIGPCQGFGIIRSDRMVPIETTNPGQKVEISVQIETPPLQGCYIAEWKMIDADGDYVFPDRFPLSVVVQVG